MTFRIALLGISHESNTFISRKTTLENFREAFLLKGTEIADAFRDAYHEIGGMMEVLESNEIEFLPVMYASAAPGGIISNETYAVLLSEMMNELEKVLPVDGCLVVAHGAAVSEQYEDMDGHWLSIVRKKLGTGIPIVGTLDPHANASAQMIASTDALIAYKKNPHTDQRETGFEAAALLLECIKKKAFPKQVLLQLPLAISIDNQHTESWPCNSLLSYAASLSKGKNMLSVSVLFGFPYADVKDMGTAVIAISNDSAETASSVAGKIFDYILVDVERFKTKEEDISRIVQKIRASAKPVLLLDMGDNVGAGAPGNSTYLLNQFQQFGILNYFICLNEPMAVLESGKYELGEEFILNVGEGGTQNDPCKLKVKLIRIADGKFREPNPRHDGLMHFDMGQVAIVYISDGGMLMLTSVRTPPYSLVQLTHFGIDPNEFDVIVAKGVNAPIAAYELVCRSVIKAHSPGLTQADMTRFHYLNRRKPMFPFEIISSLYPAHA